MARRDFSRPPGHGRSQPDQTRAPGRGTQDVATSAPADAATTDAPGHGRGGRFVIEEHRARAPHWDIRLDHDGVLQSWALPKGLPLAEGTSHPATRTEDHPPAHPARTGQDTARGGPAGATVTVFDQGGYELESWSADRVQVVLHGERAHGRYLFCRAAGQGRGPHDWMVRRMDPSPEPGRLPMPPRLAPMLAVRAELPVGPDWAYEVKWDGARVLAFVEGGRVLARSRSGRDVTATYPELRALGTALGATQAVLDGEVVAFGPDGRPDFDLLARRMHISDPGAARRAAERVPVGYLVFDLLFLNGRPTTGLTYDQRRALLAELPGLTLSEQLPGDGPAVLAATAAAGLEGIVAKRRSSAYQPGRRSSDWVKVKNVRTQSVVIGGWEPGAGSRASSIGALLVGVATATATATGPAGGRDGGR
ncbi:MAG: ATP-dependent DNA ligase, partial [Frankia sp.]|nr:ATP-dependent DNA ligase [Frankia sp.]